MSKYIKVTDVELGGSIKIGDIELSNTDLADLIEGGSGSGAGLALGVTSTTAYRGDHGLTAYNHSQEAHAPSDAQKNSDITKTEIEAKLTGEISSHTHTDSGGFANPMTTAGDIIVGGTDGAPARLAKGADGKVLGVESGAVAWVTPTGGGDKGDMLTPATMAVTYIDDTTGVTMARLDDVYDSITLFDTAVNCQSLLITLKSANPLITGDIALVPVINAVAQAEAIVAVGADWTTIELPLTATVASIRLVRDTGSANDTLKDGATIVTAQVAGISYKGA